MRATIRFIGFSLLTVLLSSCGGGSATNTQPSTSDGRTLSTSGAYSSATSSTALSSTALSSTALSSLSALAISVPSFTGNQVRMIGRFDKRFSGSARFTWPGSALEFRFYGTRATLGISDTGRNRFVVRIDDTQFSFMPALGDYQYILANGLALTEHQVRITRVTESFQGMSAFIADPSVDGNLLLPPAEPSRKILVLGDSITAGMGVEGENIYCETTPLNANQQLTYAALAANALHADLHAIAWSGIGVYRNSGEKIPSTPTLGALNKRTLGLDETYLWDITQYSPDAILIAIGTNDYWEGRPNDYFRAALLELIHNLQIDYPQKPIYLIVSPMLSGDVRIAHKQVIESLADNKVYPLDLGANIGDDGFGCYYHPNTITHARLSNLLIERLRKDLGWQ